MNSKALIIPAAVLAAVLSACGSPAATSGDDGATKVDSHAKEVFDEFNAMTGTERSDALLEAAQEEGELSLYTSNTDMDSIVDAFTDEYGIDVNVYRGGSESVLQRILQESKAGYRGADLIEAGSGELNVLGKEGLLYPYQSEFREKVRPEGQKDDWTADRFNAFVVAWNTDAVKPGQEPKSLADFADPAWNGRVSMEVADIDWFATLYGYYLDQGKSEAEVDEMFQKIAANSKIVKGHTVQTELLSAGEFDAAVAQYSHAVDKGVAAGQPVSWRPANGEPVQPVVVRANGAGLVGSAQHPAAATLFMDFLLTEGQQAIADAFRVGSVPTDNDPLAGLEVLPVDEDVMLNQVKEWDEKYAAIVEGGRAQ